MKKWGTFGAVLVIVASMIGWALSDDRLSVTEQAAMNSIGFQSSLPKSECMTADDVIAAAQAHGWDHGTRKDFPYCVSPTGLSEWHWVAVEPALPFSTEDENRLYFGFDEAGCSLDWEYTTCD